MQTLSDRTLAAIGRMTVAATDLEYVLAWVGAGDDVDAVFAQPGGALTAARASAHSEELKALVEAAGTQLLVSQAALRRPWTNDAPVDPATFDDITAMLVRCQECLRNLVRTAPEPSVAHRTG